MAVVEQAAVTISACIRALLEKLGDAVAVQLRRQFRALCSLHAMHRPQCLRQTVQFNLLEYVLARMTRRETAMIFRMAILCGDHERKRRLKPVRDRDYFVAVR